MDHVERAVLIAQYATGYDAVAEALNGATDAQLDAREAPGEWSPREVIHHLADSEMQSAFRIRQLVAEEHATIQGYDQERFAATLHYDRPVEGSILAFRGARDATLPLLQAMTDEDWAGAGTHTETGPFTAGDWLRYYAVHAHDHAEQIRRARATVHSS
jgi:hypothetical protein